MSVCTASTATSATVGMTVISFPLARPIEGGHPLGSRGRRLSPSGQDSSRPHPGVAVRLDGHLAVHDHPLDAVGEAPRLVVGGVRAHAVGVEDDEVGRQAVADQAAVAQPSRAAGAEVI